MRRRFMVSLLVGWGVSIEYGCGIEPPPIPISLEHDNGFLWTASAALRCAAHFGRARAAAFRSPPSRSRTGRGLCRSRSRRTCALGSRRQGGCAGDCRRRCAAMPSGAPGRRVPNRIAHQRRRVTGAAVTAGARGGARRDRVRDILRILSADAGRAWWPRSRCCVGRGTGRESTDTARVRAFVKQRRAKLGDHAPRPAPPASPPSAVSATGPPDRVRREGARSRPRYGPAPCRIAQWRRRPRTAYSPAPGRLPDCPVRLRQTRRQQPRFSNVSKIRIAAIQGVRPDPHPSRCRAGQSPVP